MNAWLQCKKNPCWRSMLHLVSAVPDTYAHGILVPGRRHGTQQSVFSNFQMLALRIPRVFQVGVLGRQRTSAENTDLEILSIQTERLH